MTPEHEEYLSRMTALAAEISDPAERAGADANVQAARRILQHADRMESLPGMDGTTDTDRRYLASLSRNERRRWLKGVGVPTFSQRNRA
jgi:hypothetical protein